MTPQLAPHALTVTHGRAVRLVLVSAAVITSLVGLGAATLVGLFAQNAYELTLAVIMAVVTLAIAAGLGWLSQRMRARVEAQRRAQIEQGLANLIAERGGVVTAEDVAQHIGITMPEAEALLEGLVRTGSAEMDVTNRGEIRFHVGAPRQREQVRA